jgi:hypothetical protein
MATVYSDQNLEPRVNIKECPLDTSPAASRRPPHPLRFARR